MAYDVIQTADLGYIVVGYTESFGAGDKDVWILKLLSNGNLDWERTYGGSDSVNLGEEAYSVFETSDGGYILSGMATSFTVDDNPDCWILKLNSDGSMNWEATYGGDNFEWCKSVIETSDNYYVAVGLLQSPSFDNDVYMLKLNSSGGINIQRRYGAGSNNDEEGQAVIEDSDGNYVIAASSDNDGAGLLDGYLLKVSLTLGSIIWQKTYGGTNDDYFYDLVETTTGSLAVVGYTGSFGAGSHDLFFGKVDSDGSIGGTCSIENDATAAESPDNLIPEDNAESTSTGNAVSVNDMSLSVSDTSFTVENQCIGQ